MALGTPTILDNNTAGSGTSASTGSITPAGATVYALFGVRHTAMDAALDSITGGGATWTLLGNHSTSPASTPNELWLYKGEGFSGSGTIDITWTNAGKCAWVVWGVSDGGGGQSVSVYAETERDSSTKTFNTGEVTSVGGGLLFMCHGGQDTFASGDQQAGFTFGAFADTGGSGGVAASCCMSFKVSVAETINPLYTSGSFKQRNIGMTQEIEEAAGPPAPSGARK